MQSHIRTRTLAAAFLLTALAGAAIGAASLMGLTRPESSPAGQLQPPVLSSPEGAAVSRGLTGAEKAFLALNPDYFRNQNAGRRSAPPTGPVECAAEYEPMEGILLAWESFNPVLTELAKHITTTGNANAYVVVDTAGEQTTATTTLTNGGVNMSRVKFYIRTTDTVWIRDYGPRYIYEGNVRAIVDHTYNRPRPNDDAFSPWFGQQRKEDVYDVGLVHGGGNYHLNALDKSYCTRLINNENPTLTETQIHDKWSAFQGVDTHFFDPFPTSLDSTQHLDMWVEVYGDHQVMVSDWPVTGGDMTTADTICDNAATYFAGQGFTVNRLPARQVGGVHYTYTNVIICNNLIIVPSYTNTTIVNAGYNTQAFNTWQAANPTKTVVQVNGQSVVTSAGVFHCIAMHVPVNRGGVNPVAYLRSPNGGATFTPGEQVTIAWATDDDVAVTNVDLMLSLDGGETFPYPIASAITDDGSESWTVPDYNTAHARVKVVARDADGHTGFDTSDADFSIAGTCRADFDLTGFADTDDYDAFVQAFEEGTLRADVDGSGFVDLEDFDTFVQWFQEGC